MHHTLKVHRIQLHSVLIMTLKYKVLSKNMKKHALTDNERQKRRGGEKREFLMTATRKERRKSRIKSIQNAVIEKQNLKIKGNESQPNKSVSLQIQI